MRSPDQRGRARGPALRPGLGAGGEAQELALARAAGVHARQLAKLAKTELLVLEFARARYAREGIALAALVGVARSNPVPFEADVTRSLSERGRVRVSPGPAVSAGPSAQIEKTKERLSRDIAEARASLSSAKSAVRHGARATVLLAAVLLAAGIAVIAARARRGFWRRL